MTIHHLNIRGNDTGIWRRVHLIPFTYTFPEEHRKERSLVLAEFKEELPGILNWVIEGYQSYAENGLIVPEAVSSATQDYREETDTLGVFINEKCQVGEDWECLLKDLYNSYKEWCENNKEYATAKNSRQLAGLLRERGFDVCRGTGNKNYVIGLIPSLEEMPKGDELLSYPNDPDS